MHEVEWENRLSLSCLHPSLALAWLQRDCSADVWIHCITSALKQFVNKEGCFHLITTVYSKFRTP